MQRADKNWCCFCSVPLVNRISRIYLSSFSVSHLAKFPFVLPSITIENIDWYRSWEKSKLNMFYLVVLGIDEDWKYRIQQLFFLKNWIVLRIRYSLGFTPNIWIMYFSVSYTSINNNWKHRLTQILKFKGKILSLLAVLRAEDAEINNSVSNILSNHFKNF